MPDFFWYFFNGVEIIGTVAFAASGAMLAIDRDLDLFGVLLLGVTTAVGGGVMRDVLLGTFPPNAFSNSIYVAVAFATALAVFLFAYLKEEPYWKQRARMDRIVNLLDAIGLGIFSVVGAETALNRGFAGNAFLCIFMGMMTGVGGGILRDMMSQTIPFVLKKLIYAVASIAGAGAYYALIQLSLDRTEAMLTGLLLTVAIRMLATHFAWDLPKVHHH